MTTTDELDRLTAEEHERQMAAFERLAARGGLPDLEDAHKLGGAMQDLFTILEGHAVDAETFNHAPEDLEVAIPLSSVRAEHVAALAVIAETIGGYAADYQELADRIGGQVRNVEEFRAYLHDRSDDDAR